MRDTNRLRKSQAIRDAALALFLERGVGSVSVDDIMKAARMAKGSFYRYFDDQEALVAAIIGALHRDVTAALTTCRAELETAGTRDMQFAAYRKLGQVIYELLLGQPGAVRLYLQESRAPAVGARRPIVALARAISDYAVQITEKAQSHGILRPIPPVISALTVVGAAERLLLGVMLDEPLGNVLEIPDKVTTLILDGLKA